MGALKDGRKRWRKVYRARGFTPAGRSGGGRARAGHGMPRRLRLDDESFRASAVNTLRSSERAGRVVRPRCLGVSAECVRPCCHVRPQCSSHVCVSRSALYRAEVCGSAEEGEANHDERQASSSSYPLPTVTPRLSSLAYVPAPTLAEGCFVLRGRRGHLALAPPPGGAPLFVHPPLMGASPAAAACRVLVRSTAFLVSAGRRAVLSERPR